MAVDKFFHKVRANNSSAMNGAASMLCIGRCDRAVRANGNRQSAFQPLQLQLLGGVHVFAQPRAHAHHCHLSWQSLLAAGAAATIGRDATDGNKRKLVFRPAFRYQKGLSVTLVTARPADPL